MPKLKVLWNRSDEAVLYLAIIISLLGAVNIFSASFVLAAQQTHDYGFFLKKQIVALAVALPGMLFFAKLNYKRLPGMLPLFIIAAFGLLFATQIAGIEANGAKRWLQLGIIFQPSEFAKLVAVLLAAAYLGPKVESGGTVSLLSWPLAVTLVMSIMVLRQPDMGTAIVILGVSVIMYLMTAKVPRQQVMIFGGTSLLMVIFLVGVASYRLERISAWLDPWEYQQTSGYQMVQSLLAIGSGGLFGTGLGKGASKFNYLPEAHTDFAFAVLCQEMGFVGALFVLALFALIAWYGIKIAVNADDGLGLMLGAGCTFLIVGQAVGNIAMVCGLLPVTGIPLPFISFGGTSLVVNFMAVGVLISVGRFGAVKKEPVIELIKRGKKCQ